MAKLSEIYIALTLRDKDYDLKIKKAHKTTQTFAQKVQKKFDSINLKRAALAITAFAVATAYALNRWVIKPFIGAADAAEQYMIILSTLLRSQAEGNRLFQEMQKYAARVPFKFMEIMESVTSLAGVMRGGVNEIKEWVPMIGDLAAAYKMTFRDTTSQIIRMYSAGAAAADMFRDKGVSTMLGFKAGVAYTAEETRRMIMQAWTKLDSQFRGATAKLATTWSGLMSMIQDAWDLFKIAVMEAGVFKYLKDKVQLLIDKINEMKTSGAFNALAQTFSDKVVGGLEKIWSHKDDIISVFKAIETASKAILAAIEGWKLIGNLYSKYGITNWQKEFAQYGVKTRYGTKLPSWGGDTAHQNALMSAYEAQKKRITQMRKEAYARMPAIHKGTWTPEKQEGQGAITSIPYYFGKAPMIPKAATMAYPRLGGFPGAGMGMKRTYESQLLGLQTATKTATQEISSQWQTLSWNMQSSWSYTMENMMRGGMSFGNFMKNMFMDVYNSYARMISDMVAERLYERTFESKNFFGEAIETGLSLIGLGKKTTPAAEVIPKVGKAAHGGDVYVKVDGPSADAIVGIVYENMDRNGLLGK